MAIEILYEPLTTYQLKSKLKELGRLKEIKIKEIDDYKNINYLKNMYIKGYELIEINS